MERGQLLLFAERALERIPRSKLAALAGQFVHLSEIAPTPDATVPSVLEEVRRFYAASMRGDYYKGFFVNSSNFTAMSPSTEAFIAELDRILALCAHEGDHGSRASAREALEIIFGLLRHIDECHDDVVFWADEGGVWQLDIDWGRALSAYFVCVAESASPEDLVREIQMKIDEFKPSPREIEHAVSKLLLCASVAQKTTLQESALIQRGRRELIWG